MHCYHVVTDGLECHLGLFSLSDDFNFVGDARQILVSVNLVDFGELLVLEKVNCERREMIESYWFLDDFAPSVDLESHLLLEHLTSSVTDGDDLSVLEKIGIFYKIRKGLFLIRQSTSNCSDIDAGCLITAKSFSNLELLAIGLGGSGVLNTHDLLERVLLK